MNMFSITDIIIYSMFRVFLESKAHNKDAHKKSQ